ncbi:Protein kinase domain protein [Theileria parva strain Muguga]|uniref:Cyclin-dependent kinase 2 homolog n=1 Tax=Theileria parva TaxID=5875 RepID=Q4N0J6_THEPA|nr:Protein kinase domain protein [Theileria parva strain Muguga]EAN30875.1 Protein kinase domain protein [Theileria parva strain Muguga]|eukprot:XP_763158.1 cell division cycle 2 protein kinase [Theileria parva strain Muguga]
MNYYWPLGSDTSGGSRPLKLKLESKTESSIIRLKENHIKLISSRISGNLDKIIDSLSEHELNRLYSEIGPIPTTANEFFTFLGSFIPSFSDQDRPTILIDKLKNYCKKEAQLDHLEHIRKDWELITRITNSNKLESYIPLVKLEGKTLEPLLSQLERKNHLLNDKEHDFKLLFPSSGPVRLKNFVKIHQVGQGAYGDVWLAEDIVNKKPVALKKLKLNEEREGFPKNAIREILLLNSLKHKNIVNLLGICYSKSYSTSLLSDGLSSSKEELNEDDHKSKFNPKNPDKSKSAYGHTPSYSRRGSHDKGRDFHRSHREARNKPSNADQNKNDEDKNKNKNRDKDKKNDRENVWMVFEYLPFDLSGYIEALRDPHEKYDKLARPSVWLSIGEIKTIMRQLFRALNYCHKNNVLHRDLKTANLLMDQDGVIKLADFGLARFLPHGKGLLTNRVVTLWYRSPELLLGSESYDFSVDLWSAGCIMSELVSGSHIFAADKESLILKLICEYLGLPDEADLKYLRTLPLWNDKNSNPLHPERIGSIITRQREFEKIFTKVNQLGKDGWDLLKTLFSWSPSTRITAKQALLHPWFTNEPLPKLLTNRHNIKAAHNFMTKNQRKRENLRPSQKRHEYVKYANTGDIRKVLKKQLSISL